jgi:hypothetical protein
MIQHFTVTGVLGSLRQRIPRLAPPQEATCRFEGGATTGVNAPAEGDWVVTTVT